MTEEKYQELIKKWQEYTKDREKCIEDIFKRLKKKYKNASKEDVLKTMAYEKYMLLKSAGGKNEQN